MGHSRITLQPLTQSEWNLEAEALMRVQPMRVPQGGSISIEIEVRCTKGIRRLYNGFLSEQLKLPAKIVITSADGKVRRELLGTGSAGRQASTEKSWTYVHDLVTIGRELTVKIANDPQSEIAAQPVKAVYLVPGEYDIQVIYNHWLLAGWPNAPRPVPLRRGSATGDEPQVKDGWSESQMDEPFLISKPVRVTVTDDRTSVQDNVSLVESDCPLRLEIRPSSIAAKPGRQVDLEIRMTNQSDQSLTVFNPILDPKVPWRLRVIDLVISRPDGSYLGDLLWSGFESSRGELDSDWVKVTPGGTMSSSFRYLAGSVPKTSFTATSPLPPGTYALELRGHKSLLNPHPKITVRTDSKNRLLDFNSFEELRLAFAGTEICRSNRVELEILPRTGD